MKKTIYLLLTMILLLTFTGCQKVDNSNQDNSNPSAPEQEENATPPSEEPDSTLDQEEGETSKSELFSIISKIYEIKDPGLALGDIPVDLTNTDSVKYYTGLTDTSMVKDIAVSEAMIGSQAYSLVLVQVNNASDANSVANEMLNGIDQRKWVCVEADDLQVVAQDDLVMLFMVSSELKDSVTSQDIVNAFKDVRGGEVDIELKK